MVLCARGRTDESWMSRGVIPVQGCMYLVLCAHGRTDVSRASRGVIPVQGCAYLVLCARGISVQGTWKRQYMSSA